jgi:hypothetical protein
MAVFMCSCVVLQDHPHPMSTHPHNNEDNSGESPTEGIACGKILPQKGEKLWANLKYEPRMKQRICPFC